MRKLVWAVLGTVCVAFSAVAAEYTWTGGGTDAGVWTDPANWGVASGWPGSAGGDIANVGADVEITESFEIAEGRLRLNVTPAKTLTLRGVVSGAGGLDVRGGGALKLYATNTFTGDFTTQGNNKTSEQTPVSVCASGALGKGKVWVDPDSWTAGAKNGYYGLIYITPGSEDDTITLDNDIDFGGGDHQSPKIYFNSGSAVLNGKITAYTRPYFGGHPKCRTVTFNGDIKPESLQWLHLDGFSSNTHFWFNGALEPSTLYTYSFPGTVHLKGVSKCYQNLCTRLVCEADDVLYDEMMYFTFSYRANQDRGGIIDLNGHDQTFIKMWSTKNNSYPTTEEGRDLTGFTSPEGSPAQVIFNGNCQNNYINVPFRGTAGFQWNVNYNLTFSNAVSTTKGEFAVSRGRFALAHGAQFTALKKLTIGADAKFVMDADAADTSFARTLDVKPTSRLELPAGKKIETLHFVYDGAEIPGVRTYTKADYPDLIVGDGAIEVVREQCVFTAAHDSLWSDARNWQSGELPGADTDVVLSGGLSARIDLATPVYHSVTVGDGLAASTLTFTNGACLSATEITVSNGATVTCAGPFREEAAMETIHFVCSNLTVAAGGKVTATAKGWSGAQYGGTSLAACGPGRGTDVYGASHGGHGGFDILKPGQPPTYGSAEHPATAGSGGTRNNYGNYTHGGGVIRIEATGALVVDGEIAADAVGCSDVTSTGKPMRESAGAGGSVWIDCGSASGSGSITAKGGRGVTPFVPYVFHTTDTDARYGRAGGGGRIAIYYDAARQAAVTPHLRISAEEGSYLVTLKGVDYTLANSDLYFSDAEPGTLKFTDQTIVNQLFGSGLSGRLLDVKTIVVAGDLDFSYGHVRFEEEGMSLAVGGNLTVRSPAARLEVGAGVFTNRTPYNCKWAGEQLVSLTVGGALAVTNGAALDIRAGGSTSLEWGAEVTVGGEMKIGEKSFVYAWCDGIRRCPVRFTVGSLDVQAGGTFSANDRGGAGGWLGGYWQTVCPEFSRERGYGDGGGKGSGGSHGGLGGKGYAPASGTEFGTVYACTTEDPYRPHLAGAGGGSSGYGYAMPGGGVIYVEAKGAIRVDGAVSADATLLCAYDNQNYYHYSGYGAGGSIYLFGDTFASGATARLSARGGDSIAATTLGGGGCIAVWTGRRNLHGGTSKQLARYAEDTTPAALGFAGTFDVTGGTNVLSSSTSQYYRPYSDAYKSVPVTHGSAGTIRFATIRPRSGAAIVVK